MKKIWVIMIIVTLSLFSCSKDKKESENDIDDTNDVEATDESTDEAADEAADEATDEAADEVADEATDESTDETTDESTDETADETEDEVADDDVVEVDPCDPNPCGTSEPICVADEGETEGYKCYQEYLEIAGEYSDNYGGEQIIGSSIWNQGAMMGKFNISSWDNNSNFLVAQNDSSNGFNPDKYSRFDWTFDGTDIYFCQTVYDKETAQDAIDATPANSTDLDAGCSGFSWNKLIHVPMDILGEHKSGAEPYETDHIVTFGVWDQGAMMGAFNLKARYNSQKFAIAQNDSGNGYNPNKWSRFDWTVSEGKTYYCQTVYDAGRFEDAFNAEAADSDNLSAGCGGFGWSEFTDTSLEIVGVYQSGSGEWVTDHTISQTVWSQGVAGSYKVEAFFNTEGYLVAQNGSENGYNPDKWSRFDWTVSEEKTYYCQSTYDADNIVDVFDAVGADSANLTTGCGGFPWSLLTPVVETGIDKDDAKIVAWATGHAAYTPGANVDVEWQTPEKALGAAEGTSSDIVCLGSGGSIVLTFANPVKNGEGADFAVFENAFNDTNLELGYVEVSSDGTKFVRFDTYYLGTEPVGAYGGHESSLIWGFAGKFKQGLGTQFDLEDLAGKTEVTDSTVDLDAITHIKIVDVVGDGSELDTLGNPIYDPYPTTGSAGFDLDAVGIINE